MTSKRRSSPSLRRLGRSRPSRGVRYTTTSAHTAEIDRLDAILAGLEPGGSEYKKVATAKAREARGRDTAARHAGLTAALTAAKAKATDKPTRRVSEWFMQDDDGEPLHECDLDAYFSEAGCSCGSTS